MNTLSKLFPEPPTYKGSWQSIYIEPIIGSGERIAIAAVAFGENNEFNIIQSIQSELLECLYGSQASSMQNMIDWLIESATSEIKNNNRSLAKWTPPFEGVKIGQLFEAADEDIQGILRQAIRFTSSLSALALDSEREENDEYPRRRTEQWASSISEEARSINPRLSRFFKQKIKVNQSNLLTTYGFVTEKYVSNFGLLIPIRLPISLNGIKAKLFDLESLKKSNIVLIKPEKYEILIGVPSFQDPTLTSKSVQKLKETIEMVTELARTENIGVFKAESAKQAAEHLQEMAA